MPVYYPKRFARPETLREIAPKDLLRLLRPHRKFFAEHGLELPAEKSPPKLDLVGIGNILLSPDLRPPPDLADALHHINQMASHEGMDALLPVIEDSQISFRLSDCTPADVAVRAWLTDPEHLRRKHAEIQALRPRRFEYFQSPADPPSPLPELTPDLLARLEGYLDATFVAKGRGRGVKVLPCPGESDCMFIVRHGDPNRREGALEDREETSVFYRPSYDQKLWMVTGQ